MEFLLNILVIGDCSEKFCELIRASILVNKIYTASKNPLRSIANIEFQNINELVEKSKLLNIDIAILFDKNMINDGILEVFKKNRINLISVNKKWFNLETSRLIAKQLVTYYSINTPQILKVPVSFPLVIKTDSPKITYIATSMEDLICQREKLSNERFFLEEYCDGDIIECLSAWDGKTSLLFEPNNLTEVQIDRLNLYRTKLNFLLSDENADFIGFFVSKLMWYKNDWYFVEFKMGIDEVLLLNSIKKDLVYIINAAIYQKLHEI